MSFELVVDFATTKVVGGGPIELIKRPLHYVERVFLTSKTRAARQAIAKNTGGRFDSNAPMVVDRFLYDDFDNTFPTGMLPKVVEILKSYNFEFSIRDLRTGSGNQIAINNPIGDYEHIKPFPYQNDAIDRIIAKKRGIVQVACGGGKTVIAGESIRNIRKRAVFLVNRAGLLTQTKKVFEQMLNVPIGQVGDGIVDVQEISVVMIQTLVRFLGKEYVAFDEEDTEEDATDVQKYAKQIDDMLKGTDVIFLDECHCVGAQTAFDCLSAFSKAEWRIGLSATPWREDGKDIYFEGCFGEKLISISFTFLIDNGFLLRPYICFLPLQGNVLPLQTHARYQTIYKQAVVNNEYRNRLAIMEARMLEAQGHRPMLLVQHVAHGNILKADMPEASFVHGAHSSNQRGEVLGQFRRGEIPILISSTIMDEAIDIPECDCVIMAGGGASHARTIQRISRGMRVNRKNPNKKYCVVIDFFDEDKYLSRHCWVRQNTYRREKAFEIILPGQPRPFDVF